MSTIGSKLRQIALVRLVHEISALDSGELETVAHHIISVLEDKPLIHRGLNIEGKPVKGTVDSFDDNGRTVIECSTEHKYFDDPFKKPLADLAHALQRSTQVEHVYLVSTQECPNSTWPSVQDALINRSAGKTVSLFDRRRIAEEIYDRCVINDALRNRIGEFLPSLEELFAMYSLENARPPAPKDIIGREVEVHELGIKLADHRVVFLCAMSGVGKTYVALSLAEASISQYGCIFWIDGEAFTRTRDLRAINVARLGTTLNLHYRLTQAKCLLVVDDLRCNFDILQEQMLATKSDCIVTTQICPDGNPDSVYKLDMLTKSMARTLLSLVPGLTEAFLDRIWEKTGGHALSLAIIRDTIASGECTWQELVEDLNNLASFESPDGGRTVISRILDRHTSGLRYELQALKWLEAKIIDEQLLRKIIGVTGRIKLQKRSLIKGATAGLLSIHDIVLSCFSVLPIDANLANSAENNFWAYFSSYWQSAPYHFRRSMHLHANKVRQWTRTFSPQPAIQEYVALLIDEDGKDKERVSALQLFPLEKYANDAIAVACIIEAYEWAYRMSCSKDEKRRLAEEAITSIERTSPCVSNAEVLANLCHHKGKFLHYLQRDDEAMRAFEETIKRDSTSYQSDLQMARILASRKDFKNAQEHIRRIVNAYISDPVSISITVVLAAFSEMAQKNNSEVRKEFILDNCDVLVSAIEQGTVEGFSQPYNTIARLGRDLYWGAPELFGTLYKSLAIPGAISMRKAEAFDAAECIKSHAKAQREMGRSQQEVLEILQEAGPYYDVAKVDGPFQLVRYAEWLILCDRFSDAVSALAKISEDKRDCFYHHRNAQALLGEKKTQDAMIEIEAALSSCDKPQFRSAFLEVKADIQRELGNAGALATLQLAIDECQDEKYGKAMAAKLAQWQK